MVTSRLAVKEDAAGLTVDGDRANVMAKPGALGLPKLLEERRLKYGITDSAFSMQPYHDTVLVYQLSRMQGETFGDGPILMPDTSKKREHESTPQGVVVAAGLCALDSLRMNAMDLGHVVAFCRVAPWRMETDKVNGKWEQVLVFRVADIVGSLDLAKNLRSGDMAVGFDKDAYEHFYHNEETGENWHPQRDSAYQPDRS